MKKTNKTYNSALVIGKFMPMHKGHKALIDYADSQAEITTVCVLGHPSEPIPLTLRTEWVTKTYSDKFGLRTRACINIIAVEYDDTKLNSSSESDKQSSIEWAEFLKNIITENEIDVIIGSEKYVQYMAEYLNLAYLIYDEDRNNVHISATAIKEDIVNNWDYLVPAVKQFYAKHICISGSESTGKTTICSQMENELPFVTMIPEIGRCLVGNAMTCLPTTLVEVMKIHAQLIDQAMFDPPTPIVVWDTDNITTQSYYKWLFKKDIYPLQKKFADKYFFFDSNIPYKKDVTRVEEEDAKSLRKSHLKCFEDWGIKIEMVSDNRKTIVENYLWETLFDIQRKINTNES